MSEKSPISIDEIVDCKVILKSIRIIFDLLPEEVAGNIDDLMISETKIDESFPVGIILLPEFSVLYRSDRD